MVDVLGSGSCAMHWHDVPAIEERARCWARELCHPSPLVRLVRDRLLPEVRRVELLRLENKRARS